MQLKNIIQPEILKVDKKLRLRKYDDNYIQAVKYYQTPLIYQNSE